jgi:hypothetical protein
MRPSHIASVALGLALSGAASAEYLSEKLQAFLDPAYSGEKPVSGILCKLPGSRTAGDTPPTLAVRGDLKEFLAVAYAAPKEGRTPWHGDTRKHELHIVGGIVPPYKPEVAAFLKEDVPPAGADLEGAVKLFDWFVDSTPKRGARPKDTPPTGTEAVFREVIGTPGVDSMYCNQAVSIFRAVLAQRGITSRVVCTFAEGYGRGGSHTFLEVWDPAQGRWLFFDPKFGFYSTTLSAADVLYRTTHLLPYTGATALAITSRSGGKSAPAKTTRVAVPLWYIENGETGRRMEFSDPEFFAPR